MRPLCRLCTLSPRSSHRPAPVKMTRLSGIHERLAHEYSSKPPDCTYKLTLRRFPDLNNDRRKLSARATTVHYCYCCRSIYLPAEMESCVLMVMK
ncbi:hypothetical protein B566_EDAN001481 [Ephemera danica]|nr:hypothetical protein B566_EDAN001481 [Ephemera danica]